MLTIQIHYVVTSSTSFFADIDGDEKDNDISVMTKIVIINLFICTRVELYMYEKTH